MRANYNPRKEHSIRKRYGFKNPKKSFLIICEGENTEPDYFNAFRLTSATVKAVGKGLGTMNLVKEAIIITKFGASPPRLTAKNPVVFSEHHHPKTLKTL